MEGLLYTYVWEITLGKASNLKVLILEWNENRLGWNYVIIWKTFEEMLMKEAVHTSFPGAVLSLTLSFFSVSLYILIYKLVNLTC